MALADCLEITLSKLMRNTHTQAAWFCLLLLLAACDWLTQVGFAQALAQQAVKESNLVRKEIPASANQWLSLRQTLALHYPKQVFAHPAKPEAVILQVGKESLLVEFDSQGRMLRIEGASKEVQAVSRLSVAHTTESQVSKDRAFRFQKLGKQGQVAMAAFSQNLATWKNDSVTPSAVRLASGTQEPAGAPQIDSTQKSDQKNPASNVPQSPPDRLPLPQFEGVQIEMLPELDAVILRGRDQQLTDLSEIIKRLDDASRESKPTIEVVPLQHVNSQSMSELIEDVQEKFIGTRQGRVTVSPLVSPNALLVIGWGESMDLMKQLIQQLDQPTKNESTLAVIPLKHAAASDVQTQLQSFYKGKEGLAPVVNSFADSRSNAIIVNGSPRDIAEIKKLLEQIDVPRNGMVQAARVFQIRHNLAADIAEALQDALATTTADRNKTLQLVDENGEPFATGGVLGTTKITVNDRNNTIIVASTPETLPLIEQFIQQLDTPGAVAKIKIFAIKNGDASSLVETLRALIPSSSSTAGAAPGPQLSSNPDDNSLLPLRFTVDTRGNNIIAIGSEGDLKIVEALILRLDEGEASKRKSTVYQLKNSPAIDVATAINQFLQSKRIVELAAPGVNNPFDQLEREVVVVPEPVQNKLILSATPRYYDEIAQLIQRLDEQPPQVMIQVMIAEILLGNTDEFGIEMGIQDSVLFDRSLLGNLVTTTATTNTSTPAGVVTETTQDIVAASNNPGFNFNNGDPLGNSGSSKALQNSKLVGGQGLSNFAVGRTNDELGFGGLVLSASSENVSFLLRALQETRRLEILSRPQVLTLDNQQAFIQVGQRVPRIAATSVNQFGVQNQLALENVGLIIGVTPRISPEGNVVMEIDAEKSKLGPEAEGIPIFIAQDGTVVRSPRIDTITAQATVSAADGETIILGGLISRSTRTRHRQVPWLGDIPILKYLFSYDYFDENRTELLIIMTPHVVRNPGDMERLKQAEFARMSWCEADIFAMHGDVFPRTGMIQEWQEEDDSVPVIYPDIDPRGSLQPNSNTESVLRRMAGPEYFQGQPIPDASGSIVGGQEAQVYTSDLPAPVVISNPQKESSKEPAKKASAGLLRMPRTIKPGS
ncbi:MAG: secretin N-terminal domain-containing protein [Planctomycetota bacterium]